MLLAVHLCDASVGPYLDVRSFLDLIDQVLRHCGRQSVSADQYDNAFSVLGKIHRRLARRVARSHDMDIQPVGVRRLAARRAISDAFSSQRVDPLDRQSPPRHTAREDDRPRAENVSPVERKVTIEIDPDRRRLSLSLKRVADSDASHVRGDGEEEGDEAYGEYEPSGSYETESYETESYEPQPYEPEAQEDAGGETLEPVP